jgi:hypothetical protein
MSDDYRTDIKKIPMGMTIMAVSPSGIHFIGRRNPSCVYYDARSGKTVAVNKLDPITGAYVGSYRAVKWKPFEGTFQNSKSKTKVIEGVAKIQTKKRSSVSISNIDNLKKKMPNGNVDSYKSLTKLMKKHKVSTGAAYRWIYDKKLDSVKIGSSRLVNEEQFTALCSSEAYRRTWRGRKRKPVQQTNTVSVQPAPQKRWWQFWR